MQSKKITLLYLLLLSFLTSATTAWGKFIVESQVDLTLEIKGFSELDELSLFKGMLSADSKHEIDTPYLGLALLLYPGGQSYPVIIGAGECSMEIVAIEKKPVFSNCGENEYLYRSLAGESPTDGKCPSSKYPNGKYPFADLMLKGKKLLESSHSIKSINDLTIQKKIYHDFVGDNFKSLQHSDLAGRLLAQYFMMHEYVNYHIAGAPATDIKKKYQTEILNGVGEWIKILSPFLPKHEILNHCVSIYYSRSMVTLAFQIIEQFRDYGYCPGEERTIDTNADDFKYTDLTFTTGSDNQAYRLDDKNSDAVVAYISADCPVSMIETVSMARKLIQENKQTLVLVAPLEELSDTHLAMRRMVSGSNIYFINDDKWRKKNLPNRIKLPQFFIMGDTKN